MTRYMQDPTYNKLVMPFSLMTKLPFLRMQKTLVNATLRIIESLFS